MKIAMDAKTEAFYKGVSAGHKALTDVPDGTSYEALLKLFWLRVGIAAGHEHGLTKEQEIAFLQGVTTQAPQRHNEFVLTIDTTKCADFDSEDVEVVEQWVRHALRNTIENIEGDGGGVYDRRFNTLVGEWSLS